jgi:HSP20 family protein
MGGLTAAGAPPIFARARDGKPWGRRMDGPRSWMWSEALEMLARAERMKREIFPLVASSRRPEWEPPIDVLETADEILIFVALPGVPQEQVEAAIVEGELIIAGRRALPPQLRTAVIHRLELPQGVFERRIRLPSGRYSGLSRTASDGCLVIKLHKEY